MGTKERLSSPDINRAVDAQEGVINGTRLILHKTAESMAAALTDAIKLGTITSRLFSFSNVGSMTNRQRFIGRKIAFSAISDEVPTIHQFRVKFADSEKYRHAQKDLLDPHLELATSGFVEVDLKGDPGNINHLYCAEKPEDPIEIGLQEYDWMADVSTRFKSHPNEWDVYYSIGNNGDTKVDLDYANYHYVTKLRKTDKKVPLYRVRDFIPNIRLSSGGNRFYQQVVDNPTHYMTNPFARFSN